MEKAIVLANVFDTNALEKVIRERKDAVVRIGDTYEISRPLALELYKEIRNMIAGMGGNVREKAEVLHADRNMVVMEFRIAVELPHPEAPEGKVVIEVSDVGDAYADEKNKKDILGRTALTRAMKRAMERLVGEEFINKTILSLFPEAKDREVPASEKQINYVKALLKKTGKELKDLGIDKTPEELTYSEARRVIDTLKRS